VSDNDITAPAPERLPHWAVGAVNLASPRLGTKAIACSDDSFAAMARMLEDEPAVFKPDVYDAFGKWMDGWESKRRRDGGHDWCIVGLGVRGLVAGFDIDTSHFTGNYPPAFAIFASDADEVPAEDGDWTEIVPSTDLGPSSHHLVACAVPRPWRWLKLAIYPDGGIARLRVYGQPVPDWSKAGAGGEIELSALKNGGRVLAYNDAHYGNVWALLLDGRGRDMGDGWETRRRREPGNDWLIVALGAVGIVERIEIDTAHYKGNYPDRCSLQAANVGWGTDASLVTQAMFWPELMGEQSLNADAVHLFEGEAIRPLGPVTHVKLNIFPDGGISRLRAYGRRA
jgi:allantoicase